jgi:hypothetical protein
VRVGWSVGGGRDEEVKWGGLWRGRSRGRYIVVRGVCRQVRTHGWIIGGRVCERIEGARGEVYMGDPPNVG